MNRRILFIVILLFLSVLFGCKKNVDETLDVNQQEANDTFSELEHWNIEESPLNGQAIKDNDLLYMDDSKDIECMYVTILPTYNDDGDEVYFDDLNRIRDYQVKAPVMNAYFQLGNEKGPYRELMQFDSIQANASITLRGHSTRKASQKSYKIKLSDKVEMWHNQSTINLNKHPYDPTRILNSLAFDLLQEIPDITSIKTQFVKLYIKDQSQGDSKYFKDYGYFTHVEQLNKTFLEAHTLDRSGSLYKVEYYEFHPETCLKNVDDPEYDQEAFEKLLEIKEGKDHTKLLNMIADVNDYSIPIDEVMKKHFNEENYLTWLAFNILVGNYDTQTQNYLLYCPSNSMTWYFMPWDYDGAFDNDYTTKRILDGRYHGKRQFGIAQYWNTYIHKRYFKHEENVDKLTQKIEEVYTYLTPDIVSGILSEDESYLAEVLTSPHDLIHIGDTVDGIMSTYKHLPYIATENKERYYQSLEDPMPVFLNTEWDENQRMVLSWDPSYDLQGDTIYYTVQISDTPTFQNVLYEKKRMVETAHTVDMKWDGAIYWRLLIEDEKGNTQSPYDMYRDDEGQLYQGVTKVIIPKVKGTNDEI